ncbi:UNVERIFIED_CONTAM: hypothetical protein H355_013420 [Colinus virginianus]|nr:hypothetical protein H355_013420 [Colinus virginianus]
MPLLQLGQLQQQQRTVAVHLRSQERRGRLQVYIRSSDIVFLFPDVSSASSSSGNFSQFMPHLARSQHSVSSSPQPTTKSQKCREDGMGTVKKAKSHTAFSHEQLQTLHQRFQSQKYLSPQQIRELAAALGLTYQQVNIET